eukprot:TRINITY_DN10311_c0_g1_i1.p1 TRINITY_DN10311_c0_g1~~TRINITY_DN10311_c0_g1_i1.p1  ORF type:complete len:1876 (+),score=210.27 TRINITY_DN10311_c0_g1_i1:169-5796(+)
MQNPLLLPAFDAVAEAGANEKKDSRQSVGKVGSRSMKSALRKASVMAESLVAAVGGDRAAGGKGWAPAVRFMARHGTLIEAFFILVILANTVLIIANAAVANHQGATTTWVFLADTALLSVQVVELIFKAVVYHPRYVFTELKLFWLELLIISGAVLTHAVSSHPGFQILRSFRLLKIFDRVRVYAALVESSSVLAGNTFFFLFFWILFAVGGIQMFSKSLKRVCQVGTPAGPNPTYHDSQHRPGYSSGTICDGTPQSLLLGFDFDPTVPIEAAIALTSNITTFKRVCYSAFNCFSDPPYPQDQPYRVEAIYSPSDLTAEGYNGIWHTFNNVKALFEGQYGAKVSVVTDDDVPHAEASDNPTNDPNITWSTLFPRLPCKNQRDCPADEMDFLGENGVFYYRCAETDELLSYGYVSFDTVLGAMMTVLQITTLADWGEVAFWLRAAEASVVVPIWTVLLISTMTFVVVNLNISIVQTVYEEQKKSRDGSSHAKLDVSIRNDVTQERRLPKHAWVGIVLTVLYAVSQATWYKGMSDSHRTALRVTDVVCLSGLTVEWVVRVAVNKSVGYWDSFDCVVFVVSWVNLTLFGKTYILISHLFRLAETAMKITSPDLPLHMLLRCTGNSLYPTASVTVFLIFTTLLFAAVSVHAFSDIVPNPPSDCPQESPQNPYSWAAVQPNQPWNSTYEAAGGCVTACHAVCASYSPWEPEDKYDAGGSTCPMWPPGQNNFAPPDNCSLPILDANATVTGTPSDPAEAICSGWDSGVGNPRLNFNSFWNSAITLFVMTTGDDWVYPMYNLMHCSKKTVVPLVAVFFISYFIFTNFILLNLFTAVVVEQFKVTDLVLKSVKLKRHEDMTKDVDVDQFLLGARPVATRRITKEDQMVYENERLLKLEYNKTKAKGDDQSGRGCLKRKMSCAARWVSKDYNCLLFPPYHPNVIRIREVLRSDAFERLMIFCILGSCLAAVWEPNRPNIPPTCTGSCIDEHLAFQLSQRGTTALQVISITFTTIFGIEAVMKMVTNGFLNGPQTYFGSRDHSDKLDFFILLSMVISLAFSKYRYLKIIRAYRPLRLFNKIQILKVLGSALRKSISSIWIAIGVGVGVFFVFGVVGMQLFMGRLGYCTDPCAVGRSDCVGAYEIDVENEVILVPRKWRVPHSHFDHIGSTLLTLCEVASQSDWKAVMYDTMDITHNNMQPSTNSIPWHAIYFICFVFTCGFLLVSVFISIIIENINAQRGILSLTPEQTEWVRIRKDVLFLQPELHSRKQRGLRETRLRALTSSIVRHRYFDWCINVTVIINIVILAVGEIGQGGYETVSHACLAVFIVEAWLKITALGAAIYFRQARYKVEFLIVVLSVLGILFDVIPGVGDTRFFSAIGKASRIARIFRLTSLNNTLSMFFATFIVSLPSIINVSFLLIIVLMIYSYLAGYAFGNVRDRDSIYSLCHFRSFGKSFFVLFRVLTLDNWNGIMWDAAKSTGCTPHMTWELLPTHPEFDKLNPYTDNGVFHFDDCGVPAISFVFFVSFYILGHYVILDLVVAVVLDCFSTVTTTWKRKNSEKEKWDRDLIIFRKLWAEVDVGGLGAVNKTQLVRIMDGVEQRCERLSIGVQKRNRALAFKELENLAERANFLMNLINVVRAQRRSYLSAKGFFKYGFVDVLQVIAMHSIQVRSLTFQAQGIRSEVLTELYCQISCDVLCKFSRGFVVRLRMRKLLKEYGITLRGGYPTCPHTIPQCPCWNDVQSQIKALPSYKAKAFYHNLDYNVPLFSQGYAPRLYKENFKRMTVLNCPLWIPDSVSIPLSSAVLSWIGYPPCHVPLLANVSDAEIDRDLDALFQEEPSLLGLGDHDTRASLDRDADILAADLQMADIRNSVDSVDVLLDELLR